MQREQSVIWLHADAPTKPMLGEKCNGCGVCCASETCPVARVFLWQWRGRCRALLWSKASQHYRCGMMIAPSTYLTILPNSLQSSFSRLVKRWIAADTMCDSLVSAETQIDRQATNTKSD